MRQRRGQKEIRVDFAPNGVSERISVADQLIPLRFAFVMGNPSTMINAKMTRGRTMTSVDTPKRQLSERDLAMAPVLSAKSFGRVNASPRRGSPAALAVQAGIAAFVAALATPTGYRGRNHCARERSWPRASSKRRPRRASSLCGECSGDCSNADDDPPLIIQDMDLFSSLALDLSHTENPTPNGFEVGCRVALPRQARPISADQAEFVIRHSVSSLIRPAFAERPARTKVPTEEPLFNALARTDPRRNGAHPSVAVSQPPLSPQFSGTSDRRIRLG